MLENSQCCGHQQDVFTYTDCRPLTHIPQCSSYHSSTEVKLIPVQLLMSQPRDQLYYTLRDNPGHVLQPPVLDTLPNMFLFVLLLLP